MQEASGPQLNTLNTKEHPDLYRKSIKGGYWVIFLQLVINLLSFGKVLIIANFFFLEDLGIISIALMMMEVLSTFTETGFDAALVQKKENIHTYLDTAWTAGLIKGIVLFGILFFAAPFLASIRVPEDKVSLTISILRVMSICFLINGVRNIGTIYFQKELDFRKVFTLTLTSSLTDIVLSVAFIFIFRSVWGVIAARLIAAVVNCIGSYILSSYRPRLHFEFAKARQLWGFGKWIYGSNIIGYLVSQGDNYFVWSYLGLPQLALYKYAFNFATMPATHISQIISTVSFPAYSKLQNDIPRLRDAYLKVLQMTAILSVPTAFLIFTLGPDFVQLFLKEDLHPMILALKILALKGLMSSISSTYAPVFKACGKPKILWYIAILCVIILSITIYPFTKMWGIAGTAVSTVLFGALVNPLYFFLTCRMLCCPPWKMFQQVLLPLVASLFLTIVLLAFKSFIFENATFISFFSLLIIGGSVYLALLLILDKIFNYRIKQLLIEQYEPIIKRWRER